jgi:ABC-type multidrug transport system permease subunit
MATTENDNEGVQEESPAEPKEKKINSDAIDYTKVADSPEKAKESTRSYIAVLYTWAFFITILIVFVIGYITSFEVKDYRDMLITISGILSGPLGFIIGYYFKSASAKD